LSLTSWTPTYTTSNSSPITTDYASYYSLAFGSNLLFFTDTSISIKLGPTSTDPNFTISNLPSTLLSTGYAYGAGTCSPTINLGYSTNRIQYSPIVISGGNLGGSIQINLNLPSAPTS